MMIGVFLTRRRREFFEFASHNPLDYREILDVEDVNTLALYQTIFSDGSAKFAEPFSVIDISTAEFSEVFAPYIKTHKINKVYPEELFYSALFYYYERTQSSCLQTFIPPAQDTHVAFEAVDTPLPLHKASVEKVEQEDEVSSLVDDVSLKPSFFADLSKPDLHASLEKGPVEQIEDAPVSIEEEIPKESVRTNVFVEVPQETPMPPPMQQPQAQPYPCGYQQSQPNPYGYAQQYPQSSYGCVQQSSPRNPFGYQQPVYPSTTPPLPVGLNPFGNPVTPEPSGYNPLAVQQPVQQAYSRPMRSTGALQVRRRGAGGHKRIGAPIVTFSSLTDKAGTTTTSFLLAKAMASRNPDLKIVYLDLNISNPNTISSLMGYAGSNDASIVNIATATEIDFAANLALLTETIQAGEGTFSMITFGEATFRQKTGFSAIDYNQFLSILADNFDLVLVDLGKLQGTMPYQQLVLGSTAAKHILVADGSSNRAVNTFISNAQGLLYSFEIVVNKSTPAIGTYTFSRVMHVTPLAAIGYHNNTMRFITDAMPFDGTAMQQELYALGGAL